MRIKLIVFFCFTFLVSSNAQNTWVLDPGHSSVQFSVDHLVISEVMGFFNTFKGEMTMVDDDFTTAKLVGEVDAKSISTRNNQRDAHLMSPQFFDATNHGEISFTSKTIKRESENKYRMAGDLTIKGITKPVVFEVLYKGTAKFMGQTKTGIKANTIINRTDFGLKYNSVLETGGAVVGKDVRIILNFELVKR